MKRAPVFLLLILTVTPSRAIAQPPPHEEILRSGRKIRVMTVDQIEVKLPGRGCCDYALMLEYETEMKDVDEVLLRKGIDEVWAWFKLDAEHRRLKHAFIDIDLPPGVRYGGRTQFAFDKQPDGSWKALLR